MAPASVIKCNSVRSGLCAGARVRPCREVMTAVAARLDEPADVGVMRLVSRVWNAAATDGAVTARLPKFSSGKPGNPLSVEVKHAYTLACPVANVWRRTKGRTLLGLQFVPDAYWFLDAGGSLSWLVSTFPNLQKIDATGCTIYPHLLLF